MNPQFPLNIQNESVTEKRKTNTYTMYIWNLERCNDGHLAGQMEINLCTDL